MEKRGCKTDSMTERILRLKKNDYIRKGKEKSMTVEMIAKQKR
jgi:hypothetical protein